MFFIHHHHLGASFLVILFHCFTYTSGYYLHLPAPPPPLTTTTETSSIFQSQQQHQQDQQHPTSNGLSMLFSSNLNNHDYELLNEINNNQTNGSNALLDQPPQHSQDDGCSRRFQQQFRTNPTTSAAAAKTAPSSVEQLEQFILAMNNHNLPPKTSMNESNLTEQQLEEKLPDEMEQQLEQEVEVDLLKKLTNHEQQLQPQLKFIPNSGMKGAMANSLSSPGVANHGRGAQRIKAAVLTRYSMEYRPVDESFLEQENEDQLGDDGQERIIEVWPKGRPLQIHFKSPRNQIKVLQTPLEPINQAKFEPEIERSEEEPRMYFHQIKKPIIQEVHEIITPYRRVIQEVTPVVEQVHTVVSSTSVSSGSNHHQQHMVDRKTLLPDKLNLNGAMKMPITNNKFNIINHNQISDQMQRLLRSQHPLSPSQQQKQQQQQQQQQQLHLEQDSEDSTLSPLLMGVEQQVDPTLLLQQHQQHQQHLSEQPLASSSIQQSRRVRKYLNFDRDHLRSLAIAVNGAKGSGSNIQSHHFLNNKDVQSATSASSSKITTK